MECAVSSRIAISTSANGPSSIDSCLTVNAINSSGVSRPSPPAHRMFVKINRNLIMVSISATNAHPPG